MPTVFKTFIYIKEALLGSGNSPDSEFTLHIVHLFMENYILKNKIRFLDPDSIAHLGDLCLAVCGA